MPKLTAQQRRKRSVNRRRARNSNKPTKTFSSFTQVIPKVPINFQSSYTPVLSSSNPSGDTDENDKFFAKNEVQGLRFDPEEVRSDELYDRFYALEKEILGDPSLYPGIKDQQRLSQVTSNPIIGEKDRFNIIKKVDDELNKRKTYRKKKRDKKRRTKKLKKMSSLHFDDIPEEFMRSLASNLRPRQSQYLGTLNRASRALPSVRTVNKCNAILDDIKTLLTTDLLFSRQLHDNIGKHPLSHVKFQDYLDAFLSFSDKNHTGYETMIQLNTEEVHGTWRLSHGLVNQYRLDIEEYDMSDDPYPDVPLIDVTSEWMCPPLGGSFANSEKLIKEAYLKKERNASWTRYHQEKVRLGEEPDDEEWLNIWDAELNDFDDRPWNNLFTVDGFMEITKHIGEESIINICRVKGLKNFMKFIGPIFKRGSFPWWCRHMFALFIYCPKISEKATPPLINKVMMENIKDFFIYENEEGRRLDVYNQNFSVDRMYSSLYSIFRMPSQIMYFIPMYGNNQELYDLFINKYESFKNKVFSQLPETDKNREIVCKAFHELIYLLDIGRTYEGDDVLRRHSPTMDHTEHFMNAKKIKSQINKYDRVFIKKYLTKRGRELYNMDPDSS